MLRHKCKQVAVNLAALLHKEKIPKVYKHLGIFLICNHTSSHAVTSGDLRAQSIASITYTNALKVKKPDPAQRRTEKPPADTRYAITAKITAKKIQNEVNCFSIGTKI